MMTDDPSFDQEMLTYLMGAGAQVPQQQDIQRQQLMLARLRQQSQAPTGEYTQTGAGTPSIYVRPHALQNLASLVGTGVAGYQENQLNKRSAALGQGNVDAFKSLVERLRSKRGASANMGSSGNTLTSDLPGGVGAQPY